VLELLRVKRRAEQPVLDAVRQRLGEIELGRGWQRPRNIARDDGTRGRRRVEPWFERLGHTSQDTVRGIKNASSG
jgi:hypothetical protein